MSEELKPCPCCEGLNIDKFESHHRHTVYCIKCDLGITRNTEAEAVEAWNYRRAEDALKARIAELETKLALEQIKGLDLCMCMLRSKVEKQVEDT